MPPNSALRRTVVCYYDFYRGSKQARIEQKWECSGDQRRKSPQTKPIHGLACGQLKNSILGQPRACFNKRYVFPVFYMFRPQPLSLYPALIGPIGYLGHCLLLGHTLWPHDPTKYHEHDCTSRVSSVQKYQHLYL